MLKRTTGMVSFLLALPIIVVSLITLPVSSSPDSIERLAHSSLAQPPLTQESASTPVGVEPTAPADARATFVISTLIFPTPTRTPTPVNIGNFVWDDIDHDGRQDAGEPGLAGVTVQLWNPTKSSLIDSAVTNSSGIYTVTAPTPGSYRLRVLLPTPSDHFSPKDQAGGDNQLDSDINPSGTDFGFTDTFTIASNVISTTIYDAGIIIYRTPTPTRTPTPINVGNFVWNDIDQDGIQDAGEPGIPNVVVQLWNVDKNYLYSQTTTNSNGIYTVVAPLPGDYRVRVVRPSGTGITSPNQGSNDQIDSDFSNNIITSNYGFTGVYTFASNLISITTIDAGLYYLPDPCESTLPQLISNGNFSSGIQCWSPYGNITWSINGGVFEGYRNTPASAGTASLIQDTGEPLPQFARVGLTLQMGNSSGVRKRAVVLAHNTSFSDLQICSFWIDAGRPLQNYAMNFSTSAAWDSAWLSIYIEGADNAAALRIDNVSMQHLSTGVNPDQTTCSDPNTPAAAAGFNSANLLTNSSFGAGLAPWGVWDAIEWQIAGGVFQMYRIPGGASAAVLQNSGASAALGVRMETRVDLGNSSGSRKRVLLMMHNSNFSDYQVCVFWVPGGTALSTHVMRTYAIRAWDAIWLSIYVSPDDGTQWLRVDNAEVHRRPSINPMVGTECYYGGDSVPNGILFDEPQDIPLAPTLEPTATDAPFAAPPAEAPVMVTPTATPPEGAEGQIGE